MINSKLNRLLVGGILGLLSGISYGFTVLPWVAESMLPISDTLYLKMAQIAVPAALLWIPGGSLAGLRGSIRSGAKVMALAGSVAGLLYAIWATGFGNLPFIGVSIAVAALYGMGAGLLIGGGLPQPLPKSEE